MEQNKPKPQTLEEFCAENDPGPGWFRQPGERLLRELNNDRLYRELIERAEQRSREYYSKPAPTLTEEQRIERNRQRIEIARRNNCRVTDVVWHGPDQCWTFK